MAQEAVETGLNSWKSGEKAEALKSRPEPIDFFDEDWLGGGQLVEFKLIRTFMDTDALPRCAVELTIRKAEAPPTSVTVTYQVVKKPYPVIARDPFN